jgi:hypothetical protein
MRMAAVAAAASGFARVEIDPADAIQLTDTVADLYGALRELVERRERACRDMGGNPNGSDGRYARAHAALARARGETP